MMHLDLKNPFEVSEHNSKLLLKSVLLTNGESRDISLFCVCGVRGSVMFASVKGSKRQSFSVVLLSVILLKIGTKRYMIHLYNN